MSLSVGSVVSYYIYICFTRLHLQVITCVCVSLCYFSGTLLLVIMFHYVISVVREFQEYVEPDQAQTTPATRRGGPTGHQKGDEDKVLLPLGENTLTHNLGLHIVVVITKVRRQNLAEHRLL